MSRSENDLAVSVRKALSPEESAPKRKHVRSCIVYSWDHKTSNAFWQALKIQPLLSDEVQTFKALICIHKLLQEGHPNCLREAENQAPWIDSLGRSFASESLRGYGVLIREYTSLLLAKLKFHKLHAEFNGTLEYEEYVTLKTTLDPNEGYETTSNLMALQDQINAFQKLIFSHFRHGLTNECKISALVPLVQESYGVYRFITSMLRAMFQANELVEVLEPLEKRYIAQFHRLATFYYECANLKYLSRLITLPKLPERPVDLRKGNESVYLGRQPLERQESTLIVNSPESDAIGASSDSTPEVLDSHRFWEGPSDELNQVQQPDFAVIPELEYLSLTQEQNVPRYGGAPFMQAQSPVVRQSDPSITVFANYETRINELEDTIRAMQSSSAANVSSVQANLSQSAMRSEMWAKKYENLAQLYSRLRKEHLGTIEKAKELEAKLKDFTSLAQRCKVLQKTAQERSIQILALERDRDAALAKIQTLKDQRDLLSNDESRSGKTAQSLVSSLEERDQEVAIVKEAFEQSLVQLDELSVQNNKSQKELFSIINIILQACAMHCQQAKSQVVPTALNGDDGPSRCLQQLLGECDILLTHLPEALSNGAVDLIAENCLELSHAIGFAMMYSNFLLSQLSGDQQLQLDTLTAEALSRAEIVFSSISASLTLHSSSGKKTHQDVSGLQEILFKIYALFEDVEFGKQARQSQPPLKEDLQTVLERAEQAKLSAHKLRQNLDNAEYTTFALGLSRQIVGISLEITSAVGVLLDTAARIEGNANTDFKVTGDRQSLYQDSGNWSNGFISASKAVAGAISVLISVADGVLREENDMEQLDVVAQNVISATTQLVVAARVKLNTSDTLTIQLEKAAASVISSCRLLHTQIRESMKEIDASTVHFSMTPYELKVAEMDQQVKIVQLEVALQSARIKLGELRKLSYSLSPED